MKKLLAVCIVLLGVLLVPYENFAGIVIPDWLIVTMGILKGALIIVVLYCLTMWLYFALKKRTRTRYAVEFSFVAVVLLFSIAGKMAISYIEDTGEVKYDTWDSTVKFVYSVFQAVGGLSFDGLPYYKSYENLYAMYYATSSLYAGLVVLSVVTFSLSYEIYSFFAWVNFSGKGKSKVYIFTAITEDSVALAHSIDKKNRTCLADVYRNILTKQGAESERKAGVGQKIVAAAKAVVKYIFRQKYAIIFLRTEGREAFSGKNPLCLDIMHSGFLFLTYSPGKHDKSITEFLRINSKDRDLTSPHGRKLFNEDYADGKVEEIHIFALDWEKEKTCVNDKVVFDDVGRNVRRKFKDKKVFIPEDYLCEEEYEKRFAEANKEEKKVVKAARNAQVDRLFGEMRLSTVNYYFLSSEDIDISNVDMRCDSELAKFAKGDAIEKGKEISLLSYIGYFARKAEGNDTGKSPEAYNRLKKHFRFYAVNEASLAAADFALKKSELIRDCPMLYEQELRDKNYRAMIIGFGQNGQQTMNAAYVFAASGEHGNGADYEGEEKDSPLLGYNPQPFVADVFDKNADELGGVYRIKHSDVEVRYADSDEVNDCSEVAAKKQVRLRVNMYRESAFSKEFIKRADKNTGLRKCSKYDYNLIVIALGNDDSNVSIANALLEDVKHELMRGSGKDGYQTIAINLRDKQNYDRINWCGNDARRFDKVKVIVYGAAEDMYCYDGIVNWENAKYCNYVYSCIERGLKDGNDNVLRKDMGDVCTGKKTADKLYLSGGYYKKLTESYDPAGIEMQWDSTAQLSFYNRLSSRYAAMFYPFTRSQCAIKFSGGKNGAFDDVSTENLVRLGAVEHDRWSRYMTVNGYVQGEVKRLSVKEHPDIRKYDELKGENRCYDVINVLSAFYLADNGKNV